MPGVSANHSGMVAGVDLTAASDCDLAGFRFHPDQRGRVVVLVLVGQLLLRVLVFHLPLEDLLPLRFLRRQAQALERVDDGSVEAIAGGVADGEAHQERNL